MSVSAVNNATRSTIIEYAQVLVDLDKLISEYQDTDSDENKVLKARTLSTLIYLLKDINTMGFAGAESMQTLTSQIIERAQPVLNTLSGQSPSQIAKALDNFIYTNLATKTKTNVVNTALDPTQWQNLSIRDAISDVAFFEYYRKADASTVATIGTLGNRIQVSEKFLDAINNIYQGSTWNPGEKFINTATSQLQDYQDSDGQTQYWWSKFQTDLVASTMSEGIQKLKTMKDAGLFPEGSIEQTTTDYILDKWTTSYSQGGYGGVATADAANRMWSDKQFRKMVEDAVNGSSRINEQNQLSMSQILTNYDFFTRSATSFVGKENDSVLASAQRIKPQ